MMTVVPKHTNTKEASMDLICCQGDSNRLFKMPVIIVLTSLCSWVCHVLVKEGNRFVTSLVGPQ